MSEYFIKAHSFAAPFCSDESPHFIEAETPEAALERLAAEYRHPCGLYSANAYADANAMHKGAKPLSIWRSLVAQEIEGMSLVTPSDRERIQKKHGTRGAVVRSGC